MLAGHHSQAGLSGNTSADMLLGYLMSEGAQCTGKKNLKKANKDSSSNHLAGAFLGCHLNVDAHGDSLLVGQLVELIHVVNYQTFVFVTQRFHF